jgi:hypothetical protein
MGKHMALDNTLTGWVSGPPLSRDDGAIAIIELVDSAKVDGQDHFGQPIIVSRWSGKLKTTGSAHRLSYEDVLRHIDLAKDSRETECPIELRSLMKRELDTLGLRYMLAMYWQGRADKISGDLWQLLEWITRNGLPKEVSSGWVNFKAGEVAFEGRGHANLLEEAMEFSRKSLK